MATVEQRVEARPAEIAVENPATGEIVRAVPATAPADVPAIVARARAAQPGWEALGFRARGAVLRRARTWLLDNAERVIETIVSETGKTYEDALIEIAYAAPAFGFWAKHAEKYLRDERIRSSSAFVKGRRLVVRRRPVGVVAVIGPWNYPLVNTFGDCIPALAAGNAVVLKPSEVTPLTSLFMAEGMRRCGLPEDVLQVAPGWGETGAALVGAADMVMFTGSTETGRKVMARAAETLTPVSLELGGKDPMIVLSDADIERAANAAVYASMQNAGQTCISVERAYVEAPVYDEFVDRVSRQVRRLRQGVPSGPGTADVGAITFAPQLEIVRRHVEAAKAGGARVLAGGAAKDGGGRFFEPTVLVDLDPATPALHEETFGPTLPIVKVADADEAVRLANDSQYGLSASVWSRDVERGERIARRIEAGAVCVNDAQVNYYALELPMGGWKQSGLGVRHGAAGIRKYTREQAILVRRFVPFKKEIHHLPYRRATSRLLLRGLRLLYGRRSRD